MSLSQRFSDIADAIREKSSTTDTYTPLEMPTAIRNIPQGGSLDNLKLFIEGGTGRYDIPEGITKIGSNAFYNRTFNPITIPNTVTQIEGYAFSNCNNLTSITIPNTVTQLGNGIFYSCNNLEYVTLPSNITTIPSSMFNQCDSLRFRNVTIPNTVTQIGDSAFSSTMLNDNIIIPEGITKIGSNAFSLSGKADKIIITLPSTLVEIGMDAFVFSDSYSSQIVIVNSDITTYGAHILGSVASTSRYGGTKVIFNNTGKIYSNAFYGSASLVEVEITYNPIIDDSSITKVPFKNCTNLTTLRLKSNIPPVLTNGYFITLSNIQTIYVPYSEDHSVLNTYKSANNWSQFASRMIEESPTN